jgi:hypothetical protein
MRNTPNGVLQPPVFLSEEDSRLIGFRWLEEFKPKSKDDIFEWRELPKNEDETDIYDGFRIEEMNTATPPGK